MPIIKLRNSDLALGIVFSVLYRQREALPFAGLYAAAERLAPEWAAQTATWRSLVRRAVRFLAAQGLVIEVTKGHWKLGVK